jgi:hypothetical protein
LNTTVIKYILKEGLLVSTRLGPGNVWYNNIIYKVDDTRIVLSLIDSYLENIIMLNSHFELKYANEFFEYVFEGIVVDINPKHPRCVTVLVKKAEELVNTRFFPRYDTYIASTIKKLWDDVWHFSIVNNICLDGMAFICKHELNYGDEIDICIYLPDVEVICTRGKVLRKRHTNNLFNYSLQFIQMDETGSIKLSDYLAIADEINSNLTNFFLEHVKDQLI